MGTCFSLSLLFSFQRVAPEIARNGRGAYRLTRRVTPGSSPHPIYFPSTYFLDAAVESSRHTSHFFLLLLLLWCQQIRNCSTSIAETRNVLKKNKIKFFPAGSSENYARISYWFLSRSIKKRKKKRRKIALRTKSSELCKQRNKSKLAFQIREMIDEQLEEIGDAFLWR